MDFAKNLRRLRLSKNLTQEQAASTLGVSAQSISRWECGTTLPDVTILPAIARLYCVTIDDLYRDNATPYANYAERLGSVFEASHQPEDFLQADMEYRKLLESGKYTMDDLRSYGVLHQYMMQISRDKALELFDRGLKMGKTQDTEVYWRTRRQKGYLLFEIGRNQENIQEFLPLVEAGSDEIQEWICLIQAYTFAEENETALYWANKAEKKFPENTSLHIYMGDLYRSMKQYDQAFVHWQRAKELEPNWLDSTYSMAFCYEELGDYANAYRVWTSIADDLAARGFEAEVNWPRDMAKKCLEKTQT
ncbi:MAG: helix-turn-helix domain-containing protein [Oscillospiraceae bacterium]|nr:helix-turn-helix domain-containing protein [Oscillospiraceae bacterium]